MKQLKQCPTTDYNKFPQKYYFISVAKNIIKIANLKNTNKIILDFGCGQKIFSKILKNNKIINYDIKPEYTECETYENSGKSVEFCGKCIVKITDKSLCSGRFPALWEPRRVEIGKNLLLGAKNVPKPKRCVTHIYIHEIDRFLGFGHVNNMKFMGNHEIS